MPKLKVLSGADIVTILASFGFGIESQKGSHLKLARVTASGAREIITVPSHKNLRKGTAKAIFNQVSRFVSQEDLRPHFYTE